MIIYLLLHLYQIRNFWFDIGTNELLHIPSIILTLTPSTINLIKDDILKYWISEISRNCKKYGFTTSIKLNVASFKIIAIDETMQNINQVFNIWKKQFIVLASQNPKNSEKIAKFCLI